MSSPLLLVCASDDVAAHSVIKGILKNEAPPLELNKAGTPETVWNIENKYYHADVCLRSLVDGQNLAHVDFHAVEAVVIYIQNYKGESLATADMRKQRLPQSNCEMNILLCDKCSDLFPREQAMVWCLDNDYQLIELYEEPEPMDDSCPIKDYFGMDRVIHTLHTQTWSNLEPRDECSSNCIQNFSEDEGDGEDDLEYMDEFCKLFAHMSSVTQNASSMPGEGRKAYAEQVVKAFWKAIGGDESELEDSVNT